MSLLRGKLVIFALLNYHVILYENICYNFPLPSIVIFLISDMKIHFEHSQGTNVSKKNNYNYEKKNKLRKDVCTYGMNSICYGT